MSYVPVYDNNTLTCLENKALEGNMEQILTPDELAEHLKVSRRTIYRMLEAGELPFALKIKGSWRFRLNDISSWLETCKVYSK